MYWAVRVAKGHLDPPANGQAVIFLAGLLEVFIFLIRLWQQYQTIPYQDIKLCHKIKLASCVFVIPVFSMF